MSRKCKGIAERFAIILGEFSSKESVNINDLVNITGSDKRNLQMDLNRRLKEPFGISTDNQGNYWMDKKYQGLFSAQDIKEYSRILGASEIFPELSSGFISDLIERKSFSSILIKSPYKDSIKDNNLFHQLVKSINRCKKIRIGYKFKRYSLEPYRLVNMYGIWYLFALHEGTLKSFKFSKIENISESMESFSMDYKIVKEIAESETVWLSSREKTDVLIKVLPEFKNYFYSNIQIPNIESITESPDGSLLVLIKVSFFEQIKNIVKYWIPKMEILEPESLKKELKDEISMYLNSISTLQR